MRYFEFSEKCNPPLLSWYLTTGFQGTVSLRRAYSASCTSPSANPAATGKRHLFKSQSPGGSVPTEIKRSNAEDTFHASSVTSQTCPTSRWKVRTRFWSLISEVDFKLMGMWNLSLFDIDYYFLTLCFVREDNVLTGSGSWLEGSLIVSKSNL